MAEQLSVFVDNRPGRLNAITGILRDCRINIRAMTIADHRNYGVAKLLVSDPHLAQRALAEQCFAAALKSVLAEAGTLPVRLNVLHVNRAKSLYERLGFRTILQDARRQIMEWRAR